jgi:hypothetical protein
MKGDFHVRFLERLKLKCFCLLDSPLNDLYECEGQKHKVFEDSFDAKPIYNRSFLLQKINYIHLNCIRGKWKLVEHWEDYEHSSALFYVKNKLTGFVPVHYEELS